MKNPLNVLHVERVLFTICVIHFSKPTKLAHT